MPKPLNLDPEGPEYALTVWAWIDRYDAERQRIKKRIAQRRELYRKFKLEGF